MFALIIDGIIKVGPRSWLYSFFKEGLVEAGIEYDLPREAPSEPIITEQFKILPVVITTPEYTHPFEQLAGPYLQIGETEVVGTYNVVPTELSFAQSFIKSDATNIRYEKEVGGTSFTFADGVTVDLYTDRVNRRAYAENLVGLGDADTITFKFKNSVFKTITKQNLSDIVKTVNSWLDYCFAWEASKYAEIEACQTMDDLKKVSLNFPGQSEV